MRLAVLSTYPPRPCGIGSFSADLRRALLVADPLVEVEVLAMVRAPGQAAAPEVRAAIRQDAHADYVAAAALINDEAYDVVLIEHEFGIFGGDSGEHLLLLIRDLAVPFVLTLHTVLSHPSAEQRSVLARLCARAVLVTVFTETARRMMIDLGLVDADRVRVVPHGAPAGLVGVRGRHPERHIRSVGKLAGRTVLSTFGLISSGKGIETAIAALPAVVGRHPEVVYLVAGQTHPEVVQQEGEQYRLQLERLVRDLDLGRSVRFVDRFLTDDDLAELLGATDLYLTPYRSREQIVSGALTFAIAAGCPVVSTPYFYAEDLLADGAGTLVDFDDPAAMANAVLAYLDDPAALAAAADRAREVGATLAWPAVGARTLAVLGEAVDRSAALPAPDQGIRVASAPPVRTDHLMTLVDDVGIIQHANGTVPRLETGYTVDDVARLLLVALDLGRGPQQERVIARALGFLAHAWRPAAGGMHNEMSFDRTWADEPTLGDHVGRAAWALGAVLAAHPPRVVSRPSADLLGALCAVIPASDSPRTMAYTLLGLTRSPLALLPDPARRLIRPLTDRLIELYRQTAQPAWPWFEDGLYYDNARLPQALIAAGRRLDDAAATDLGLSSLRWLGEQYDLDGPFVRLIPNDWRHRSGGTPTGSAADAEAAEQPVDAAALVEALVEAFQSTGDRSYAEQALHAFEWFLGRNQLQVSMYDFATGGTHDGLAPSGRSENEGAESTLVFFQALLALEEAGLQSTLLPAPGGPAAP